MTKSVFGLRNKYMDRQKDFVVKLEALQHVSKNHVDVMKMRDYPSLFLGVFFPTSPLIPHFYDGTCLFLRHFVKHLKLYLSK